MRQYVFPRSILGGGNLEPSLKNLKSTLSCMYGMTLTSVILSTTATAAMLEAYYVTAVQLTYASKLLSVELHQSRYSVCD